MTINQRQGRTGMKKLVLLAVLCFASLSALTAQAPELFLQTGHSEGINAVAYSPDGGRIATGSYDDTIKVWDAENGRELMTLAGHSGWVSSVGFSPDGRHIISGSNDKTVKIWNAETGWEFRTL